MLFPYTCDWETQHEKIGSRGNALQSRRKAGRSCALIDPHGDLAARVVARIPPRRQNDLVYVNLPNPTRPYGYNPLAHVPTERRSLLAKGRWNKRRQITEMAL